MVNKEKESLFDPSLDIKDFNLGLKRLLKDLKLQNTVPSEIKKISNIKDVLVGVKKQQKTKRIQCQLLSILHLR